ncbi:hypothetical protein ABTM54_19595, partial [Acinetobacter baumannii]
LPAKSLRHRGGPRYNRAMIEGAPDSDPPADDAAPLPTPPEALLDHLAALGITVTTHRHPPVHTVDASRALRGSLPGGHCKNLFL